MLQLPLVLSVFVLAKLDIIQSDRFIDKPCVSYKTYLPTGVCIDYLKDAFVAMNPEDANERDNVDFGTLELVKILFQEGSVPFMIKNLNWYIKRFCGTTPAIKERLQDLIDKLRRIKYPISIENLKYFKWFLCHVKYPICIATSPSLYNISLPCRDMAVLVKEHLPYSTTVLSHWVPIANLCNRIRAPPINRQLSYLINVTFYPQANLKFIEKCQKTVFLSDRTSEHVDCYEGKGMEYNGTENVAENGKQCIHWKSIYALRSPFFSNLTNNYCRNHQGYGERPWCYTNNKTREWSYCQIEKCGSKKGVNTSVVVIVLSIMAVPVFLFTLLFVLKTKLRFHDEVLLQSLKKKLLSKEEAVIEPVYITYLDDNTIPKRLSYKDAV